MAMMRSRISFFIFCWVCKFLTGYEVIQGHIEESGHFDKDINVWCAAALFVHAYGACTDMEFLGQLGLIQPLAFAQQSNSPG